MGRYTCQIDGKEPNFHKRQYDWAFLCVSICVLCSASAVLTVLSRGIFDSDYFWHCTLGEYIVKHKAIFREDIFSWIAAQNGYVETAHSWLGSVIIYCFSKVFSTTAASAAAFAGLTTFIMSLLMIWFYGAPLNKGTAKTQALNSAVAILAGATSKVCYSSPRPLTFGIIFFLAAMILLHDGYENLDSKKCWLLPLLSVIWANVHGGSIPILFAFNGLFLALSLLPSFSYHGIGKTTSFSWKRAKRMFALLAANVSAALINPYGYKLFIYFFYTNNDVTKKYVSEWQPISLKNPIVIFALVILALALLVKKRGKIIELSYICPVLATLYMASKYSRIKSYLIFTSFMLLFHVLHTLYSEYEPKKINTLSFKKIAIMTCAVGVAIAIIDGVQMQSTEKHFQDGDPVTTELQSVLDDLQPQRMFTTYDDGGYLIYHGYSSFIDSRADLFPNELLVDSIRFYNSTKIGSDELQAFLDTYEFDAILLPRNSVVSAWLELHPDWTPCFEDGERILFAKRP